MTTRNIFLSGVGGQGVILAGEILCLGLMEAGFDVKKSEVHGMAQRGGSVTSHVRYGEKVYSPLIPQGESDILLAFEALEGLRWLGFVKQSGLVLINCQEIKPTTVTSGRMKYPEKIYDLIREKHANTRVIDALEIARQAGSDRALNSVLVGAVSRELEVPESTWKRVISRKFPKKLVDVNWRAFDLGRAA